MSTKKVVPSPAVARSLEEKREVIPDFGWVRQEILTTLWSDRVYYDADRFYIRKNRRTDHKTVEILIRVEETETEFVVLLVHVEEKK